MPLHDWTKADDGLFHDFHNSWLIHLKDALNGGVLPAGYFAMTDQRADVHVPDVLTFTRNGGTGGTETGGWQSPNHKASAGSYCGGGVLASVGACSCATPGEWSA